MSLQRFQPFVACLPRRGDPVRERERARIEAAVDGIGSAVDAGRTLAIVGESGGGRSSRACSGTRDRVPPMPPMPPMPSRGSMRDSAKNGMDNAPWMAIWPGPSIFLPVPACHLLGDGLRDALDPRQR